MSAISGIATLFSKIQNALAFEKRLGPQGKLIVGITFFAVWLATPYSVKVMILSTHCINLGLGLLLHGLILYRQKKPTVGFNLNLNRQCTLALGAVLLGLGVEVYYGDLPALLVNGRLQRHLPQLQQSRSQRDEDVACWKELVERTKFQ